MSTHDRLDSALVAAPKHGPGPLIPKSSGKLDLAGWTNIECYNVPDGKLMLRLIRCESFFDIVDISRSGRNRPAQAIRVIDHAPLSKRVSDLIEEITFPIELNVAGATVMCYEHTVITKYCKAVLEARRAKRIAGEAYMAHADCCERFLSAAADVGLAALIDEATGYSQEKQKTEYRDLFREYIRQEMRDWEKEFPDLFFDGIYKIYHLRREPKKNHPQFFAKFIRKYVYYPLGESNGTVLAMLEEKNPIVGTGRKHKLHQFLAEEVGLKKLRAHIWQVVGVLGTANSRASFQRNFKNAFPRAFDQLEFDLDDI